MNRGLEINELCNCYVTLPDDILNIIYEKLCKMKCISNELKQDILSFHLIHEIIAKYKKHVSANYQHWLENNLNIVLNHGLTNTVGTNSKRIGKLWKAMTTEQKVFFYKHYTLF